MIEQYFSSLSSETKKLELYFYKAQATREEDNTNMMIPLHEYPPVLVKIGDQPITIAQGPISGQSGEGNFAQYWSTDKTTVTIDGDVTTENREELSGYTFMTKVEVISVVFKSESLTSIPTLEEPIVPFEPCFKGDFDMYKDYLEWAYFKDQMEVKAKLRKRKAERLSETVVVLKQEDVLGVLGHICIL